MNATLITLQPTHSAKSLFSNAAHRGSPSAGLRNAIASATNTLSNARGYFQRHADAQAQAALAVQPGKPLVPGRRGNTSEAARILGCSSSLVRWLIRVGELKNVERPGKRMYLLDLDEVHRYRLRKMEECQ